MAIWRFVGKGLGLSRVLIPICCLALAGCNGDHSSASPSSAASSGTAGGTSTTSAPTPSGTPASITTAGYKYQAALERPGITTKTTFTTNDGSGGGGTAVDAPPGKEILVATLRFTNSTGGPEPFKLEPFVGGDVGLLPLQPGAGLEDIMLAVPQAQAAAFGVKGDPSSVCVTNSIAPSGYCDLHASVGAYSPAPTGTGQFPELAPGSSATVTLLVEGGELQGQWVPQNAPIQNVKIYVSTDCGNPAGCWIEIK